MSAYLLYAIDLVAIAVLTFGVYLPRHRRRDLAVAYVGVNVGVLAVAAVLASTSLGAGLGLGLFGVLSIIRLRSDELNQDEVAYYFASLALGLIGGLGSSMGWGAVALMAAVVAVLAVLDSRLVLSRYRRQVVVLDQALADPVALSARLEGMLGGRVHRVEILRLDLVNDSTTVEVRYSAGAAPTSQGAAPMRDASRLGNQL